MREQERLRCPAVLYTVSGLLAAETLYAHQVVRLHKDRPTDFHSLLFLMIAGLCCLTVLGLTSWQASRGTPRRIAALFFFVQAAARAQIPIVLYAFYRYGLWWPDTVLAALWLWSSMLGMIVLCALQLLPKLPLHWVDRPMFVMTAGMTLYELTVYCVWASGM